MGVDMIRTINNRQTIALALLCAASQSTTVAITEFTTPQHHRGHQYSHPLELNPSSDRPFDGPLAPGIQVSGGSRLKRAKNKIRSAAERVRSLRRPVNAPPQLEIEPAFEEVTSQPEASIYYMETTTEEAYQEIQPAFVPPPPLPAQPLTTQPPKISGTEISDTIPRQGIFFMALLAIQFGIQPMLVRRYTPQGICKSSVVMTQELVKGAIAIVAFMGSTRPELRREEIAGLSIRSWLTMAGVPAAIYTVQNLLSLLAYQNLEALTFNVLNQTKNLSAALCCYLVIGKKQTKKQSFSLLLLLVSALVIEDVISFESIWGLLGGVNTLMPKSFHFSKRITHGVVPVLFASFLSGLAGALTQKNLQGVSKGKSSELTISKPVNPYLFSMELTVASVIVLVASLFVSADGKQISQNGFFHQWTPQTMIPILTNSFGGILVGLVTKHAGSVRKGFALIFGILLSGVFQAGSHGISFAQIIGGILAAMSLWLHSSSGHRAATKS